MTSEERRFRLHELMAERNWRCKHVANILNRTANTVRIWRCKHGARSIPAKALAVLEGLQA